MKNLKQNIYLSAFILGTIIPYYFVIAFILQNGLDLVNFGKILFATYPSANFVSDLLISSFIFWIFIFFDSQDKKLPNIMWFVFINIFVGLSSALPLYLYFREKNTTR